MTDLAQIIAEARAAAREAGWAFLRLDGALRRAQAALAPAPAAALSETRGAAVPDTPSASAPAPEPSLPHG